MNIHSKPVNSSAILATTLFLTLSINTTYADQRTDSPDFHRFDKHELIYSPNSAPFKTKFSEWSAQWWQFALSIPAAENPLKDSVGVKCSVGQRGPVWFLVGTLGGGSVERSCSVPAGKALFFPVLNSFYADDYTLHNNIAYAREQAAVTPNDAKTLSVTVDGQPVVNRWDDFRIRSIVFDITLPENNVFDVHPTDACPPSGTCSPAVDDGYYLMLKPFSEGFHTIHIVGETSSFKVDVTYHLTVVPVDLKGI